MTLRPLLAAIGLLATPVAVAASAPSIQPVSETTASATATRTTQAQRKAERTRPGTPLKPRVIEAPGAALMIIPASYDPSAQNGPFSSF